MAGERPSRRRDPVNRDPVSPAFGWGRSHRQPLRRGRGQGGSATVLALGCVAVLGLAGVLAVSTAALVIAQQRVQAAALAAAAAPGRRGPGATTPVEALTPGVPAGSACHRAAAELAADHLELLSCRRVAVGIAVRVAGALPPWLARWGWRRGTAVAVTATSAKAVPLMGGFP